MQPPWGHRNSCCRVVPDCYRKNFPVQLKSHRSHDIVLLCIDCHDVAHTAAERLKRSIASTYNVPVQPRHSAPDERPGDDAAWPDAGATAAAAASDAGVALEGGAGASEVGDGKADDASGKCDAGIREASDETLAVEGRPGPLSIRKAALTLERQTQLPAGRRREFEREIIRCGRADCGRAVATVLRTISPAHARSGGLGAPRSRDCCCETSMTERAVSGWWCSAGRASRRLPAGNECQR